MYEDWTQNNYDPEIHEEYLIHEWYTHSPTTSLDWPVTIFCCDCESKIWIFKVFLKT